MLTSTLTAAELIEYIPQKPPFRFVDEILSFDESCIIGTYTFKQDEHFYAGHFPDMPVTPGVILLEAMCQVGLTALGIYLMIEEFGRDQVHRFLTLFTDAEVEFTKSVYPGDKVFIHCEKIFWRRMKLRSKIEMKDPAGNLLASAIVSGMGVRKSDE